ncbi:glycosyl transferase, group 1 [Pseudomonas sp. M47T1]|uniref:glycosyltransferase n=1 Tax=Pseudomonas sp. M47T1 TaxID=1179778 RepID=UPI000260803A|nr:glycosyltransferase [Pseudomonas sp. M47T1]EIK95635.1 glycosyl transferase, group 1 [Pseudomonas sp. M47T1]
MRIVVDMQGAQAHYVKSEPSCYITNLARSLAAHSGEHEVILALSGLFEGTVEALRSEFHGLLPSDNIRVWSAPGPVNRHHPANEGRAQVAELIREAFLANLKPDLVLLSNVFDSLESETIFTIGELQQTVRSVVILDSMCEPENTATASRSNRRARQLEQIAHADNVLLLSPLDAGSVSQALGIPAERIDQLVSSPGDSFSEEALRDDAQAVLKLLEDRQENLGKSVPVTRQKLAYVSPLPPQKSGIAGYSAELLPELSRYYDIDVVTGHSDVTDPWVLANCPVRPVEWFRQNAAGYQRVIYHLGNNPMHAFMFELLEEIPGVVVLHDFYLSDVQWYCQVHGVKPDAWVKELYQGHGYKAVVDFYREGVHGTLSRYPGSLGVLSKALGVIVHSDHSLSLARQWYGEAAHCSMVPLLRVPAAAPDRARARAALGLNDDDFVVCSFGFMGKTKLNHRLLAAWEGSALLRQDRNCKLFYVGQNEASDYGLEIEQHLKARKDASSVSIVGWTDAATYEMYLAAADVGVQLRELSRGETSAAVLDCFNYGLGTVVNANGAMADLPDDVLIKLPDQFSDAHLIEALEKLRSQPQLCEGLGQRAAEYVHRDHAPAHCAQLYMERIEAHYRERNQYQAFISSVAGVIADRDANVDILTTSKCMALNQPPAIGLRRIYVDVSAMARVDLRTGIQRVVRALLLALVDSPPAGYLFEPVFLCNTTGAWHWRYARNFMLTLMGCPTGWLRDDPVDMQPGDQFLGLDFSGSYAVEGGKAKVFSRMRERGVRTTFVVYDLIPILFEEHFPPGTKDAHAQWLYEITQADAALCISAAVAHDLQYWVAVHGAPRAPHMHLQTSWFHLGADLNSSLPTTGMAEGATAVLKCLRSAPTFLSVGTIEPRKGYAQALSAFELLWAEGEQLNLVFVGKQGWMVDDLAARLRKHPQLNKRLFWLEGISDEYLEALYTSSSCLLAASEGEGFGLPLIEAAQHKLPILARALPVFHEVAGEHATFFEGDSAQNLADAVLQWIKDSREGKTIVSDDMPWLTWKQSAEQLKAALFGMEQLHSEQNRVIEHAVNKVEAVARLARRYS